MIRRRPVQELIAQLTADLADDVEAWASTMEEWSLRDLQKLFTRAGRPAARLFGLLGPQHQASASPQTAHKQERPPSPSSDGLSDMDYEEEQVAGPSRPQPKQKPPTPGESLQRRLRDLKEKLTGKRRAAPPPVYRHPASSEDDDDDDDDDDYASALSDYVDTPDRSRPALPATGYQSALKRTLKEASDAKRALFKGKGKRKRTPTEQTPARLGPRTTTRAGREKAKKQGKRVSPLEEGLQHAGDLRRDVRDATS